MKEVHGQSACLDISGGQGPLPSAQMAEGFSDKGVWRMTNCGKLDRDGYLMMVQGLEQMANLYKHAHDPTRWESLKHLFQEEGVGGLSTQAIKSIKKTKNLQPSGYNLDGICSKNLNTVLSPIIGW